ncbi:hypothetical protein [Psychrobacter sp. NG27]|uniref:hypothetical protein n=1 Tax=Psychrobacter sp. NG27 TaxID=2781966 RepID=UPI0018E01299|nr:hypothetical protein [Psychrobacter sp. NG27]MBI0425394.1 hypothetical protein [Psychrobacter sp. NG27]
MKIFNALRIGLLATVASSCLLNIAHADDALKMELTSNQVVKNSEGKTIYTPVRTAPAGTVIQYKATYINTINKDINDLMVTLPIPTNMTFTGEAVPASAQASTDGKNYADMPLMRKVDGKMVKVPYSEYRTLRWNIKLLPAKKSAAVALNTTVN